VIEIKHNINIQAEWAIEEYVKIFLIKIWLNPPTAPTTLDANIVNIKNSLNLKCESRTKGATFCHTKIKKAWNHSVVKITWGNQKWNGAMPNLITKASIIKSLAAIGK